MIEPGEAAATRPAWEPCGHEQTRRARNRGQDHDGLHQHIREVDLVDTAQEVNDDRPGCRGAELLRAEEHEGEQQAQPGSRVRLDHEQDGLAGGLNVDRGQRGEDAVIDGVVEEQDLRGLHEQGRQRQQPGLDKEVNPRGQHPDQHRQHGPHTQDAENGEQQAEDAQGEVVHQHLEAGGDLAVDGLVQQPQHERGERPQDHGPEEHGRAAVKRGQLRQAADDDPGGGDGADDGTSLSVHHPAAGVADQDRQQVVQHRGDELSQDGVRQPARLDE